MSKTKKETKQEEESRTLLVGYARRSNAGGAIKLSINTATFADCETYETSDGESYVPLVLSMAALQRSVSYRKSLRGSLKSFWDLVLALGN